MKKFVLLFLFFASSNAFAITADEVLTKSSDNMLYGLESKIGAYIVEDAAVTSLAQQYKYGSAPDNRVLIVDGDKIRTDTYGLTQGGLPVGISYISLKQGFYASSTAKLKDGKVIFTDYAKVNKNSNVLGGDDIGTSELKEVLHNKEISAAFAPENSENIKHYVLYADVKEKEKFAANLANNKLSSPQAIGAGLASLFKTKFYVDRETFLVASMETSYDRDGVEEYIKNTEEYKKIKNSTKREEYLKERVDAIVDTMRVKTEFSDFRKISGGQYFYPHKVKTEMKTGDSLLTSERIIKSFKKVSSKDISHLFNPQTADLKNSKTVSSQTPSSKESDIQPQPENKTNEDVKREIKEAVEDDVKRDIKSKAKKDILNSIRKGALGRP